VSAIAPNSAVRIATQQDMVDMGLNSGYKTSVGGVVTTSIDLAGLEIDPAGGTWMSPQDSQMYPNLLFVWTDSTNDGAIISTAAGGSIAAINSVPMASTVATLGTQLGILPDSTGINGPNGLALIPAQAPTFEVLSFPRNLHTQGTGQTFVQWQTSGGTPNGLTAIGVSIESTTPGGVFPEIGGIALVSGVIVIGAYFNDSLGNATSDILILETPPLADVNLAVQALDVGPFLFSTPAGLSFL
jgi:hypothetical protein